MGRIPRLVFGKKRTISQKKGRFKERKMNLCPAKGEKCIFSASGGPPGRRGNEKQLVSQIIIPVRLQG